MKKLVSCLLIYSCLVLGASAKCSCGHSHSSSHSSSHNTSHNHHHSATSHGSGSSSGNYLVNTEYKQQKQNFTNCSKHYAITDIRTDYYSNGQRNIYKNSTIYNSDGTVLIGNCQDFEHFIYNKNHYFIVKKDGKYQIYDSESQIISKNQYSKLKLIKENRILAGLDKRYGIIDLKENAVVPIKYNKLYQTGSDIFITKLGRYYGLIDINNKIILKSDCERIKLKSGYIIAKRYKKYGLFDLNANKILDIEYDKIKVLDGYILAKLNKKYGAINIENNKISDIKFDKIKLQRNQLYGFIKDKKEVIFEL